MIIDAGQLLRLSASVLESVGMPEDDAAIAADAMVWGELRGLPSHGVTGKLAQCVARIRAGGTPAVTTLVPIHEASGLAVLDARDAWGQVAGTRAMRIAIDKAKASGIGAAVVRNISSAAALGYYPLLAVHERMIGIATSNGPALMPPWGGTTKLLSNLAHAIGVGARRHFPILYDSATTLMSTGEMETLHARGELLPEGVLLNERGEPTRDPADWVNGLLIPSGGHRGYGLSFVLEILTGVLAGGSRFAPNVGGPNSFAEPQGVAMLLIAIDPAVSVPYEHFLERVDTLIDAAHASPPAAGVERVYVPGERGFLNAERYGRDGIPVSEKAVARLRALCNEVGVAWTLPAVGRSPDR